MSDTIYFVYNFNKLICHDSGEYWGAEPYLWQVFFKIDGETLYMDDTSNALQGHCKITMTDGRHGNLPGIGDGETCRIPTNVGFYFDSLTPIPFMGNWSIPGFAGSVTILMEEDSVSDYGAKRGYQALVDTLQTKLDSVIKDKLWELVNIYLYEGEQGIQNYFVNLTIELTSEIEKNVKDAIFNHQNWFQNIGSFIDPDDKIGSEIKIYSTNDLAAASFAEDIVYRWENEGDWEINGSFVGYILKSDEDYNCPISSYSSVFKNDGDSVVNKKIALIKESNTLLKDFRTKIFQEYPVFKDWWMKCNSYLKDWIVVSIRDSKIKKISTNLLAILPELATKPIDIIPSNIINDINTVLDSIISTGNPDCRRELLKAKEIIKKCSGKNTIELIALFNKTPLFKKKHLTKK